VRVSLSLFHFVFLSHSLFHISLSLFRSLSIYPKYSEPHSIYYSPVSTTSLSLRLFNALNLFWSYPLFSLLTTQTTLSLSLSLFYLSHSKSFLHSLLHFVAFLNHTQEINSQITQFTANRNFDMFYVFNEASTRKFLPRGKCGISGSPPPPVDRTW